MNYLKSVFCKYTLVKEIFERCILLAFPLPYLDSFLQLPPTPLIVFFCPPWTESLRLSTAEKMLELGNLKQGSECKTEDIIRECARPGEATVNSMGSWSIGPEGQRRQRKCAVGRNEGDRNMRVWRAQKRKIRNSPDHTRNQFTEIERTKAPLGQQTRDTEQKVFGILVQAVL